MHPGWRKRRDKGRRGRDRDRVVLCSVSLLLVSEFGGKGDGVWEGPRGRGRSNVPLPGLPLFPAFFGNDVTLSVHPGDPGAFGIPEPWGCCSELWQRAAEVGRMGAGCAAVPWLLSRGSALTPGMLGEAPEQWDCRCRGRLSLLLPLGSPRADAGR